ncbi:hypothetical protein [Shewanella sp. 10N.286.52.A9]|uniref:hypothetical protein n=1 Tax=Shewanella sp. 10N.286.52.A9 TaxID=3229711 RepID=UPI00355344CC
MKTYKSILTTLGILLSFSAVASDDISAPNHKDYVANELLKDLSDCYVKYDFIGKDTSAIESVLSLYDQEQVRVSINKYNSRFYQAMALGVNSVERTQLARGCGRINQRAISINEYVDNKVSETAE